MFLSTDLFFGVLFLIEQCCHILQVDEYLKWNYEQYMFGLMNFIGQSVDERQPDNHKQEKQRDDKEAEDCKSGFQLGGYLVLNGVLQLLDYAMHLGTDQEPLDEEKL